MNQRYSIFTACLATLLTLAGTGWAQQNGMSMGPREMGPGGPPPGAMPFADLNTLDADSDGKVTKAEFLDGWLKMGQTLFAKMDADNDAVLNTEELRASAPPSPPANLMGGTQPPEPSGQMRNQPPARMPDAPDFARMDKDEDGMVTKVEFSQSWRDFGDTEFSTRDENGDGVLVESELAEAPAPPVRLRPPSGQQRPSGMRRPPMMPRQGMTAPNQKQMAQPMQITQGFRRR